MKYCPVCKQEYPDDSGFCGVCGVKLEPVVQNAPESVELKNAPVAPQQTPVQPTPVQPAPVQPAPVQQVCQRCGNPLQSNTAFCPACGAPTGQGTPVATPVGPKNDAFSKGANAFVAVLKDFFTNPAKAFEDFLKSTSQLSAIVSAAITVVAFLIFTLCLCGKFSMEFYADDNIYGNGILFGAIGGVFAIAVPMLVTFIATKLAGKSVSFTAVASAHSVAMLPVAALLIVAGISAFISLQLAIFWILVAVIVKFVLSISVTNYMTGGIFASPKTLWGTAGITVVIKCIELGLLFAFAKGVLEDMLYNLLWSLF